MEFGGGLPWASAETFQRIFDSVNDAIFLHAVDGRIIDVNRTMLQIYGVSREQALQMSIERDLSGPECPVERLPDIWRAVSAGQNQLFPWKARRGDTGALFDVEVFLTRIEIGGEPAVVAAVRDTSERKRLEDQLLHAQKMEAVGRLAGGVAHDFNNLLTVITGYSEMLLESAGDICECRGELEEIRAAAEHAAALTRQLLIFSRKHISEPRLIDLNEMLVRLGKMLSRLLGEDVEVRTNVAPHLGLVFADPVQLEQVVLNLVVNARDAMPHGGRLTIETQNIVLDEEYVKRHVHVTPGRYVLFAITDTGHGMTAVTQERIFEPFFTTKDAGKGTGLGLSIVYGIVKQCGGDVWVYSEVGHGTTFKIFLPEAEGRIEAVAGPPLALPGGPETVMVLEDNEAVRRLTVEILRGVGYTILEAATPSAARGLARAHQGTIDLLLTDVILGQVSGREVARTIEQLRPGLKTLFMSGYSNHATVTGGVLEPGLAFLSKPFTPSALTHKLREVLGA
jgi:two-component system, cell cycle sensor histidine kinase and response regulator CckA